MAKGKTRQNGNSKQLKAQDIYKLVSATLQEHFQLDMANRKYTAQDIWDVLVAASVERISIEMASQLIENAPSGTMVRTLVKDMLKEHIRKLKDFPVDIFQILDDYGSNELPYPPLITNKMIRSGYGNPNRDSRPRRNQRQTDKIPRYFVR